MKPVDKLALFLFGAMIGFFFAWCQALNVMAKWDLEIDPATGHRSYNRPTVHSRHRFLTP